MAATQERTRFKRINGYGSKAFEAKIVLTTIHKISTPVNAKINAQLPANFAIASAARCPRVYFSAVGLSEILLELYPDYEFSADGCGDQMGWDAMKSDIFAKTEIRLVQRLLETRLLKSVAVPFWKGRA